MTIEEINKLEPKARIIELKKRKTKAPDAVALMKDWDEKQHAVFDETIREKRRVLIEDEVRNADGKVVQKARYEKKEVNRIGLPLEQDIVNIHTAFTVGIEPKLTLQGEDEKAKSVFEILKTIYRQNKIKFHNKRIVRSWLSEQEVAEYWYTVEDDSWWKRVLNKIIKPFGGNVPARKLKVAIWSPFRGDKLYPYFDDYGDLIVVSREYKVTDPDGTNEATKFMSIDSKKVIIYKNGELEKEFPHGFKKMPVMYTYRDKPYCHKIKTIRERLETLMSNFADCLDFNFFPKLTATGVVEDILNRGTGSEIIQLENGAQISYLTWQQSPEMAKMEFENLTERAYSLTNTPRISFENLKGSGNTFSGVAFKFAFMGAHMAVSNHAEDIEEFLQRRVNFVVHAIGCIYKKLEDAVKEVEIETEVVPFMIDNQSTNIADAVAGVQGGVLSRKQGIILAGITDAVEDEIKMIESEESKKAEESRYPIAS